MSASHLLLRTPNLVIYGFLLLHFTTPKRPKHLPPTHFDKLNASPSKGGEVSGFPLWRGQGEAKSHSSITSLAKTILSAP